MAARRDVTVVVPWWDLDPGFLTEALASLAGQERIARTLVVDNASTVAPALPPGTEVLRLPARVTLGAARNAALAQVETPYVLFLDADDLLLPGTIGFVAERLDGRPDAVASCSGIVAWDPERGTRRTAAWPPAYAFRLCRRPLLCALVNTVRALVPMTAAVLRTDPVRAAGGFPDTGEEDWVLSAALLFRGPALLDPRPGLQRRLRPDSRYALQHTDWRASVAARRELRRRLRRDPAVPLLVRAAMPLLAVPHARNAFLRWRRARRGGP